MCVQVITVWESCGFICVYVVYILLVVAKHSHGVRRKKRQAALQVRLHTCSRPQVPNLIWLCGDVAGPGPQDPVPTRQLVRRLPR